MMYWFPYEGPIPVIYKPVFKKLIQKGYKITIIASFPHFRFGRKDKWSEYKGRLFQKKNWNGINLYRVWVFAPEFISPKFRLFFRLLNYLSFSIMSLVLSIILSKKSNIVFAPSSPPLLAAFNATIISKLRKIPFVYNIQDLYPHNLKTLGILNNKVILNLLSLFERFLYKNASIITVISDKMKDIITRKRISSDQIEFIPNFHETKKIIPLPKKNPFSLEFSLQDKFIVSYIGGVSYTHGLEYVLEAADILSEQINIFFMIMGRGEHLSQIKSIALQNQLHNVIFIPEQPYERMNEIWASSDISIVCMRKGISEFQVPSKTFGIMSSGRPVIAMLDEDSEIWNIIKKSKGGICIPPEHADLFAQAVLRLYQDRIKREEMGHNARAFVSEFYSEKVVVDLYDKAFHEIVR